MSRRRRRTKSGDLSVLGVSFAIFCYLYSRTLPGAALAFIGMTATMLWICFLMPTHCDYRTQRNKPCDRMVRGKLRGCHDHGRWKRDALFAAVRLRNPGLLFRLMWSAPGLPAPAGTAQGTVSVPSKQSAVNVAMFSMTVISMIAAVVALLT